MPTKQHLTYLESTGLLGLAAEAESLRRQAQQIVEYIAAHTPAELQESFRNLPEVPNVRA